MVGKGDAVDTVLVVFGSWFLLGYLSLVARAEAPPLFLLFMAPLGVIGGAMAFAGFYRWRKRKQQQQPDSATLTSLGRWMLLGRVRRITKSYVIYISLTTFGIWLLLGMAFGTYEPSIPLVVAIVALVGGGLYIHQRYKKSWQ